MAPSLLLNIILGLKSLAGTNNLADLGPIIGHEKKFSKIYTSL